MQLQPTAQSSSFLTVEMAISALHQECVLQNQAFTPVEAYRPYADWHGSQSCTGTLLAPCQYTTYSDSASALWGAVHCADCSVRSDPNTGALQRRVPSSIANGINMVSDAFLCLGTTITTVAAATLCGASALACVLPLTVAAGTVGVIARPICICTTEELLDDWAGDIAAREHEKTIIKIQDVIAQMSFLNRASPVPITSLFPPLKSVLLTAPTRKLFAKNMSVTQLIETLQVVEKASFDQEYVPFLPKVKKNALMVLQNKTIAECGVEELEQLQGLLAQDTLLFTSLVRTSPEDSNIQGVLTRIQQHHTNPEISKKSLEQFRKEAQAEVTFVLWCGTIKREVKILKSILLQYEHFSASLISGFQETRTHSITIHLPKHEFDVFGDLVTYMKTKEIQTSDICALLFLADHLQVRDCMAACIQLLVKQFESEAPRYCVLLQCIEAHSSMYQHIFEELVYELLLRSDLPSRHALLGLVTAKKFSKCLQKFDQYLSSKELVLSNDLMRIAFDFILPHTQAKCISLVEDAIKLNSADFQFLLFFRTYPVYSTVVEKYLTYLPLSHVGKCLDFSRLNEFPELEQALILHLQKNISSQNFRCIWEIAETHRLKEVKKTCRAFFQTLPNKREITDKWDDCPFELFSVSFMSLGVSAKPE